MITMIVKLGSFWTLLMMLQVTSVYCILTSPTFDDEACYESLPPTQNCSSTQELFPALFCFDNFDPKATVSPCANVLDNLTVSCAACFAYEILGPEDIMRWALSQQEQQTHTITVGFRFRSLSLPTNRHGEQLTTRMTMIHTRSFWFSCVAPPINYTCPSANIAVFFEEYYSYDCFQSNSPGGDAINCLVKSAGDTESCQDCVTYSVFEMVDSPEHVLQQ